MTQLDEPKSRDEEPTDPSPDPLVIATQKLARVVGLLHIATGAVYNTVSALVSTFTEYNAGRQVFEATAIERFDRLDRKLNAIMSKLGVQYEEPPATQAPPPPRRPNGNDHGRG